MRRFALTFLLASMLLSACSPIVILLTREPDSTPSGESTPEPTIPPEPSSTPVPGSVLGVGPNALSGVTLTVWHGWDGKSASLFAQMAAEFSLTNAWGVKVDVVPQRNLSLLFESVASALRTPQHPDLVIALPEHALAWDAQGVVTDLAPYVSNPQYGFSADEVNDIPAAFWQQSEVDGKRVGVPAARTARLLFYNVTRAKELGFSAPPQTAAEFRKQACAANAWWKTDSDESNDGYGGWVLDTVATDSDAAWTAYSWLRAFEGDVYADGEYSFSTPENQAALRFLAELRADGCAWLSTAQSNYEVLTNGKALFAAGSLNELADQRQAFGAAVSGDQWTVIPFPGTERAIVAYGPDYIVLNSSEVRQLAAWLFVRWMLSPENQARWTRESGLFPVRTSAIELLPNIRSANPQWAAAADLIPQAKTYPQAASWRTARLVLGDGFFALFQDPSTDHAAQILDQIDSTVKDLLTD